MEARVIKKIKKDAVRKNRVVKKIRDPEKRDGKSPFSNFRISLGSSHIFGFSGERRYIKIVEAEEEGKIQKYWVQVDTVIFIPSSITWE